ncbi:MAG: ribose-phosphate pyrophosphokinase [Betaproteobacteria bacterium]|nr:ribose-phosphate pyrophosphokinase [Betaproteobacteria bacterium]
MNEPLLFALDASRPFAEAVAGHLGVALAAHEEREFEDGEHKSRPLVSVRGRDVYVIHSLCGDAAQSPNDKLLRLLFFLGALRDAAAERVTAVLPYLAYARKDRRSQPRDPVTTRYVAALFEAVGTDCVVTLDVHNPAAFENAFRCRTEELSAIGLFAGHFAAAAGDAELAVVSPDAGGIKRADRLRTRLAALTGRPVGAAFMEKYRAEGVVSGTALGGDVAGKVALIVDDLVSGGTTLARAARACREAGASRVCAAATHGVFAAAAAGTLAASALDELAITDSVGAPRLDASQLPGRFVCLSVAPLFGAAIRRMHDGGSIVALLG